MGWGVWILAHNGRRTYNAVSESKTGYEELVVCRLTCMTFCVAGLTPYTEYTAYVEVCTAVGCGNSPNVTVTTAEATPQGQF